VDPLTGTVINNVAMTATGFSIRWANGLATHPFTGELFVMLTITGTTARQLGKVDPATGVVTMIGSTGNQFAGIAFDLTGTLYGVTGDGAASNPESLFTLNTRPARQPWSPRWATARRRDIGYDPYTGNLLHCSGYDPSVRPRCSSRSTCSTCRSPTSRCRVTTTTRPCHHPLGGPQLPARRPEQRRVRHLGQWRLQPALPAQHTAKGLAFLPATNTGYLRPYGDGGAANGGYIPVLAGSGTPQANALVTLGILNGPPAAFGVMTFGTGTGTLPISPTCTLQNMPIFSFVLSFALAGGPNPGEGTYTCRCRSGRSTARESVFPGGPDRGPQLNLIGTNPLQMHVQ